MRPKFKHLRHPLQAAAIARRVASVYLEMRRFGARGRRQFRGDARYDLENVSRGFASRPDDLSGDGDLLERICTAYNKAVQQEEFAPGAYRATEWWQEVRRERLGAVIHALRTYDIDALARMYGNFFRDACGAGLIGVPYGMTEAYFGGPIRDIHRHYYMSDALYRIDYWTMQTGGRFSLRDLAGPEIGNPFGVWIDGTLVRTGSVYQHYAAQKVRSCLSPEAGVVAEIGGGFGDMAYYLLRDREGVRYLDFDVPESVALTSYYLMKTFPHLQFLLYGEREFTREEIDRSDVVLMPLFEFENMPSASVDVAFSSHAMSDISSDFMGDYLNPVARMTRSYFLYMGTRGAVETISNVITQRRYGFRLAETNPAGWHTHKCSDVREVECLYRMGGPAKPTRKYAGSEALHQQI
ncbi:putative sugar O-methyltransferase [Alloacidobacterium dinghuense]|uniref:Putative sugar O-methyltransferase n=1 Tax=Alloacidobacterium dinghuense TaxID=2763107 RepID=A0A7G8BNC0_9BACT|nr:putative sugar O-methyltransferase [Alloacidobacterium dinghuense]QNI34040.1 putative sugar O-methyltransferase [Alloacidobacterium dinghuense]